MNLEMRLVERRKLDICEKLVRDEYTRYMYEVIKELIKLIKRDKNVLKRRGISAISLVMFSYICVRIYQ